MAVKELESEIIKRLIKNKVLIYKIAEFLYNNPEVGFKEYKAVDLLTGTLINEGFNLIKTNSDLETAFLVEKKGKPGGPTIALVAEYDALPIMGHACGHNLIAAGVVGAALAVSAVISKLKGNIVVIGTPAEEGGGGKILMLKDGAWQGIDMALSFHPAAETIISPKTECSYTLSIGIKRNKPNRLTVYDIYHDIINGIDRDGLLLHSEVIKGAVSPTISPEEFSAVLKLNSNNDDVLEETISKINKKIALLNNREGFDVTINSVLKYEKLISDPRLAKLFKKRLQAKGILESERNRQFGASDLGNISKLIPCLCPLISLEKKNVQIHTRDFALEAHPAKAGKTLLLAAEILSLTILDILSEKERG